MTQSEIEHDDVEALRPKVIISGRYGQRSGSNVSAKYVHDDSNDT